ncbi:MAG: hypothetical protein WCP34_02505, partial [Pseudomonadota bacterium]
MKIRFLAGLVFAVAPMLLFPYLSWNWQDALAASGYSLPLNASDFTPAPTDGLVSVAGGVPVVSTTASHGPVVIGTTALSNAGKVKLDIQRIQVTGEGFTASNDCPPFLNPYAICTVHILFQPGRLGPFDGNLSIVGSTQDTAEILVARPLLARSNAPDGQLLTEATNTGTPSNLSVELTIPANATKASTDEKLKLFVGLLSKGTLYLHNGKQFQPW